MGNLEKIERGLEAIRTSVEAGRRYVDRFSHEIRFAQRLIDAKPEKKHESPKIHKPISFRVGRWMEEEIEQLKLLYGVEKLPISEIAMILKRTEKDVETQIKKLNL